MFYECAGSAPNSQPSIQHLAGRALHMLRVLTQHQIGFWPARICSTTAALQPSVPHHPTWMRQNNTETKTKSWKQSASLTHRARECRRRPTSKTVSASKVADLPTLLYCVWERVPGVIYYMQQNKNRTTKTLPLKSSQSSSRRFKSIFNYKCQ